MMNNAENMNKSELIEKWEKEITLLKSIKEKFKHNQIIDVSYGDQIKVISDFIIDLKQLNEATVERSEVCPQCGKGKQIFKYYGYCSMKCYENSL